MSTHRPRRTDRDTAGVLLRSVLRAAGAPAHPEELAGEPAALTAFRAAQLDPVPPSRRRSMLRTTLAKLLSVKAAVVVAGVGVSGVALAAGTDTLPNPLAKPPAAPASHAPAARTPDAVADGPDKTRGPRATPSPSLVGLCRAYEAKPSTDRGRALDSPAFTALVAAAGGLDKVDDYCGTVAATPGAGSRQPGGRPSEPPGQGRDGEPGDRPGGPVSHGPADRATDAPGGSAPGR